jgi:hypothetical protein
MSEKIEKVKSHFRENKKTYIVGGSCLVVGAAAAAVVMKYKVCVTQPTEVAQQFNQTAVGWNINQTLVSFVERSTPSKPVHLVGTDRYFASLSEAARETGHYVADISKVVNGKMPDIKGDVFELLTPVA